MIHLHFWPTPNGKKVTIPLSVFREQSLQQRTDVHGSSLNLSGAARMGIDVVGLWWHFRPRRKHRTVASAQSS